MSNEEMVETFLSAYQKHLYRDMQSCLAEDVRFADYAFEDIGGEEVMAMWHWFCVPYPPRKKAIEVPEFSFVEASGNTVVAKYRVKYLYGDHERPVDYFIKSHFTLSGGKIIRQRDEFLDISERQFAMMAFGFPVAALAYTPLLRRIVRKKAGDKLRQFMHEQGKPGSNSSK